MRLCKILIINLIILHSLVVNAQIAAFPNATSQPIWSIRTKLEHGGFRDEVVGILRNTQMCGQTYGFLVGASLDFLYPSFFVFIRTDGKKVWVKKDKSCSSKEYLLYDFGMKKGDTSYCMYYLHDPSGDTTKFWVNSIDTIFNQGRPIKRMHMGYVFNTPCGTPNNPCKTWEVDWLEGIGRTSNPFDFYLCSDWAFCRLDISLICLETNNSLQYRDSLTTSCPTTTTAVNDFENKKIDIAPNPASSLLIINNSNQYVGNQVFIVDIFGRIIRKEILDSKQSLDVSELPNGMYVLKIVSKGVIQTAKFEVIR